MEDLARANWRRKRAARKAVRFTLLHFVLILGSILFLVPFAWLVVTSLKEDEDMRRFPPIWIPRQQVKVMVDGKEAGLAYAPYQGQRVKVAVLKEMESGD